MGKKGVWKLRLRSGEREDFRTDRVVEKLRGIRVKRKVEYKGEPEDGGEACGSYA